MTPRYSDSIILETNLGRDERGELISTTNGRLEEESISVEGEEGPIKIEFD
jgi:hypothetical protein